MLDEPHLFTIQKRYFHIFTSQPNTWLTSNNELPSILCTFRSSLASSKVRIFQKIPWLIDHSTFQRSSQFPWANFCDKQLLLPPSWRFSDSGIFNEFEWEREVSPTEKDFPSRKWKNCQVKFIIISWKKITQHEEGWVVEWEREWIVCLVTSTLFGVIQWNEKCCKISWDFIERRQW